MRRDGSEQSILEYMMEDMKEQDPIHKPTIFWESASKAIFADLEKHGYQNFRSLSSALELFVPTYGIPGSGMTREELGTLERALLGITESGTKKHMTIMSMLNGEFWAHSDYRVYMAGDDRKRAPDLSHVSESKIGSPLEHFHFDNRWFSRSFLNYLLGFCFLKRYIDCSSISTVLEIGGGYGTLGEILSQVGNYCYIDVDIPPTAAIATYYLSQISSRQLLHYSATRMKDRIIIPSAGTQLVICPWQLPKLVGTVDLFVNYISFQEMEPAVVRSYLNQVDRLRASHVLLRNMREGKAKKSKNVPYGVADPVKGSDYDLFLENYRLIATNVIPFGYRTIDGFHSELRLYERLTSE